MTRGALKRWRLAIPVVIFFGLYGWAAKQLGFQEFAIPKSFDEILFNLPALLAVLAYNILPLRKWTNSGPHKSIQNNIRQKILSIAQIADDNRISQKKVMDTFYRQIDNDPTLGARSEIIMFNGLIWTSLADLSVLSILYSVFSIVTFLFGLFESQFLYLQYASLAVLSLLGQMVITNRHISLSNDQLEYMADYRADEIKSDLSQHTR